VTKLTRRHLGSDQMSQDALESWADRQRYSQRWLYARRVARMLPPRLMLKLGHPLGPLTELHADLLECRGWMPWGES
jgi:hypothetical protein